jgi:hypothetical protein
MPLGCLHRYTLLARDRNEVHEIRVESQVSRDELKAAVELALDREQEQELLLEKEYESSANGL